MDPRPLEISDHDPILRGLAYGSEGLPLLLVHDYGSDLDEWGLLPDCLASNGFQVFSIELRGHGLSEGIADPTKCLEDLMVAVSYIAKNYGDCGLLISKSTSSFATFIGEIDGAPAQILVNSRPGELSLVKQERKRAIRLVMHGTQSQEQVTHSKKIFSNLLGEKIMISSVSIGEDFSLGLQTEHLLQHVVTFFNRYIIMKEGKL